MTSRPGFLRLRGRDWPVLRFDASPVATQLLARPAPLYRRTVSTDFDSFGLEHRMTRVDGRGLGCTDPLCRHSKLS
jgi:hypothetical protein